MSSIPVSSAFTPSGSTHMAIAELDRIVDKEPVLVRISAAKRLRDAAERAARDAGEKLVTVDRLRSAVRLYEAQAA